MSETARHTPEHDPWMVDPTDPEFLAPADRWCRVCGEVHLDRLSPSEIDERLADLWTTEAKYRGWIASIRKSFSSGTAGFGSAGTLDEYRVKIDEARLAAIPFETEFVARPWSRFFLVNNPGGHVHSSMSCSTCFATTSYSWLPSLSGRTEADMVAEFGEMACTVCFPSAPSMKGFGDGTSALARYSAAERAERAVEKAAKLAEKDAKAITAPDGSPLRVNGDTLRTIVSAERKLSDVVQSFGWYGSTHPSDFEGQAFVLFEALLARGIASERIDGIVERAAKKVRKEGAEHV